MQNFTPGRDYTHYDDVPTPLHFAEGTAYEVSEVLPNLSIVVRHPDQEDDVLLTSQRIAQCEGTY